MDGGRLNPEVFEKSADVDKISELVSKLSSSDPRVSKKAIEEADAFLRKINKSSLFLCNFISF